MTKKKRKKPQGKNSSQTKKILNDSLDYGIEYALEDGLESVLEDGVKRGIKNGLESFAVNAVEEGISDILSDEFDKKATLSKSSKLSDLSKSFESSESSANTESSTENNDILNASLLKKMSDRELALGKTTKKNDLDNYSDLSDKKKNSKKPWKWFISFLKIVVVLFVLIWIGGRLYQDSNEIMKYDWTIHYYWVFLSCFIYLIAFFPASVFWYLLLHWMGQSTSFFQAIQAFYVSQLGKYLPGKAMVVVIRSAMVKGEKVRASIAAVCVFYETLTMMATGAFLSAIVILIWFREHWFYSVISLGMMLAAGLPVLPVIFIRLVHFFRLGKSDEHLREYLNRITYRTVFVGFALMTLLWFFFGVSLWAAIQGIGISPGNFMDNLPRYISATALAIVLGFAVPISPGGIGVRETILSLLLIPYFHTILMMPENSAVHVQAESLAVIVSLEQRIISILAELSLVALFFSIPAFHWFWKKINKKKSQI